MEIEIISETNNSLLKRKEFMALISHMAESTPARQIARDKLAASVNADKDNTLIIKIKSVFGAGKSKVQFRVYENTEQLKKIELPHLLKRNGFIEENKNG